MKVDENLCASAELLVKQQGVTERFVQVPGYPRMFVSLSTEDEIQTMACFVVDGVRYAIGPKRKR